MRLRGSKQCIDALSETFLYPYRILACPSNQPLLCLLPKPFESVSCFSLVVQRQCEFPAFTSTPTRFPSHQVLPKDSVVSHLLVSTILSFTHSLQLYEEFTAFPELCSRRIEEPPIFPYGVGQNAMIFSCHIANSLGEAVYGKRGP